MDQVLVMGRVIDETKRVVEGIQPDQLDDPSPCEGWTVRDVLNHITGGATMFGLCVRDGAVPDEKLGEIMGGDNLGSDYKGSFLKAVDEAQASFAIPGAMEKVVKLPFGEMPAGVALNIAIFDVMTHAWDLAKASGQSTALDPELLGIAFELARQMADGMRGPGVLGPEVSVPDDAPLQDRFAAFVGRTP